MISHSGALQDMFSMQHFCIAGLPEAAFYISDFLTEAEEAYILEKITTRPSSSWTQLTRRRLQVYPSALSAKNEMTAGPLPSWLETPAVARLLSMPLAAEAPLSAEKPLNLFSDSPHSRPNHVLINEYPPGVGVFPHEDGPAYYPIVATVSMGAHTVLDIYEKDDVTDRKAEKPRWRILQERRSLLVTTAELYKTTLHGIAETTVDEGLTEQGVANWNLLREETRKRCEQGAGKLERDLRISATLRDVLKVRDWGRLIPGLNGRR